MSESTVPSSPQLMDQDESSLDFNQNEDGIDDESEIDDSDVSEFLEEEDEFIQQETDENQIQNQENQIQNVEQEWSSGLPAQVVEIDELLLDDNIQKPTLKKAKITPKPAATKTAATKPAAMPSSSSDFDEALSDDYDDDDDDDEPVNQKPKLPVKRMKLGGPGKVGSFVPVSIQSTKKSLGVKRAFKEFGSTTATQGDKNKPILTIKVTDRSARSGKVVAPPPRPPLKPVVDVSKGNVFAKPFKVHHLN